MSASEKGHAEVVDVLIKAGASRNITKDKVRPNLINALHPFDNGCLYTICRMLCRHCTLLYKVDTLRWLKF